MQLNTNTSLIVSFYTNDWKYIEFSKRLVEDCHRLKLDNYVVELPTTGSYYHNCRMKPTYILECLEKFQRPLLWIDVDGSLVKYPDILLDVNNSFDIAANKKTWDRTQWHVNSIWFNFTEPSINFVQKWCNKSAIDDGAFQETYQELQNNIRMLELPDNIHSMVTGNQLIKDEVCFLHRLSTSEIKLREKQISKNIWNNK
jgi:hypothetical protein